MVRNDATDDAVLDASYLQEETDPDRIPKAGAGRRRARGLEVEPVLPVRYT